MADRGGDGDAPVLTEITLEQLCALVQQEINSGYESEKQEGRRRLLRVIEELAGDDLDDSASLVVGRTWRIAEVQVSGVGGIGTLTPSPLTFAPVPGVTVVRGDNGQGKTSFARAVECGLGGERDNLDEVAGDLWTASLLTQGQSAGSTQLTLVSGTARLEISTEFAEDAASPHASATLIDGDEARSVELTDAWRRALSGSRACYSYGTLQSRLVETKALQTFLEELLVLGPAWERVRTEVDKRATEASTAQKAVDNAVRRAQAREQEVATRFDADDRGPTAPAPIQWPRARDAPDVDAWLATTGLTAAALQDPVHVAADHEEHVTALHTALRSAEEELAHAEIALVGPGMSAALHHIEQIAGLRDLDGGECPLCGSSANWREHVATLSQTLGKRQDRAERVKQAIVALKSWTDAELVPLIETGAGGGPEAETAAFRAATAEGCHAHSAAHDRARVLLDALASESYQTWLRALRATSDATAEWRAELATVVSTFAAEIRGKTGVAADAGTWNKAQKTLNELQLEIRQSRQDTTTATLADALTRMLPDASVELPAIRHRGGVKQKGGVDVDLRIGGSPATLGMLSSGQRNALLLTPLIAADRSGPFGFVMIDDPVHALDDMRVDLLAQELARLALDRQVIVLTHDPRLEEHLRARCPEMTVVEMQRDPVDRTVTCTDLSLPWQALLTDAREMKLQSSSDGWQHSEDLHSVVAGLCRAAVDGALRQAVITRACRKSRDVNQELAELAAAKSTKARIEHVTALAGEPGTLPALEGGRDDHLRFWNQGSHGQLPTDHDLESTIAAAEAACSELATHDWVSG